MLCSLSTRLDKNTLNTVKDLEKELDKNRLAFSCYQLDPAEITKEQLDRIRKVEKELGISLVAVNR